MQDGALRENRTSIESLLRWALLHFLYHFDSSPNRYPQDLQYHEHATTARKKFAKVHGLHGSRLDVSLFW